MLYEFVCTLIEGFFGDRSFASALLSVLITNSTHLLLTQKRGSVLKHPLDILLGKQSEPWIHLQKPSKLKYMFCDIAIPACSSKWRLRA